MKTNEPGTLLRDTADKTLLLEDNTFLSHSCSVFWLTESVSQTRIQHFGVSDSIFGVFLEVFKLPANLIW